MLPFIIASALLGALDGSCFTSFLFLAVTKTDLPCDMKLNFRERELVVNFLLCSQNLGKFFGLLTSHFFLALTNSALLYNRPD